MSAPITSSSSAKHTCHIFFANSSLTTTLKASIKGMGGKVLAQDPTAANDKNCTGAVKARSRLSGTLNFYHRASA